MSIFGKNIQTSVFGESHGTGVGAVVKGVMPGIKVDICAIRNALCRRVSFGELSTPRRETDFVIQSGVYDGYTTGDPLCVFLPNRDIDSSAYSYVARPGHADYTQYVRSNGFCDMRGGGYHSGRLTSPLVALGAIFIPELKKHGITIASHVFDIGGIFDCALVNVDDAEKLKNADFPMLSVTAANKVKQYIRDIKSLGDSCGGVSETVIFGLPAGLGGGFADAVDAALAAEIFTVPSVKGVAFGDGFELAEMRGSTANDKLCAKNKDVTHDSNHMGGIVGGITNGMPLVIKTAFKPVPSIALPQQTVDLSDMSQKTFAMGGRHDPCTVYRALPAIDTLCALKICDMLISRFGMSYFDREARI